MSRPNTLDVFWARVDRRTPALCWLWLGRKNARGYGKFDMRGRERFAHAVAYEAIVGPIPTGKELDHLCRVHGCVNPAHLEAVSHIENVRRGRLAEVHTKITHCPSGHAYDAANTHIRSTGWRRCRACARERDKARRARLGREVACSRA